MKTHVVFVAALLMSGSASAACDRAGAIGLQANMAQLAKWKERGGTVDVTLNEFMAGQSESAQREFVTAFANTDACATGTARDLRFYSKGKLIGTASPSSGISFPVTTHPVNSRVPPISKGDLTVRGKPIRNGMEADEVFAVLKQSEMVEQEVEGDPAIPGSLRLIKKYKADGKTFQLVFTRRVKNGPYFVKTVIRKPS